LWP
jgi:hypothetical protein